MAAPNGQFELKPCPIVGPFGIQRFKQWGAEDTANWYTVKGDNTKQQFAMYPTMGRSHIFFNGYNQLIFGSEPRQLFKSIKYAYVVEGSQIYRIDSNYNQININASIPLNTNGGPIYFAFVVAVNIVFACFVDSENIYIYREDTGTFDIVTDPNAPEFPGYIAAFGNRIVVSNANSSQFNLSQINLGGGSFDPTMCFTTAGSAVFAQASGIIRQLGVLNNTLYMFTDYVTDIWSNISATLNTTGGGTVSFPWKQNATYNWNFGIANPNSLDIDFGMLVFLARNSDGLLEFRMSSGGQPERISTKPVDTLIQRYTNTYGANNPFLSTNSNGFLYQYENTIFYRMSGGNYYDYGILDQEQNGNSLEYNFEVQDWHRCIELNGERNRIQSHVYFNYKHLVTVINEGTVYEMSGKYYYNEERNPVQANSQALDAYLAYPFRYERVTPPIWEEGYAEFQTEYVQIDFVWGDSNINYSTAPFETAQFLIAEAALNNQPQYLIAEQADPDGQPIYLLGEQGDIPSLNELTYNTLYKPSIELFFSDDGGINFDSADIREFSQQGKYSWRMRWYQLGPSRNRVYKLIAVSPVPIVILGAFMSVRRMSGGAY